MLGTTTTKTKATNIKWKVWKRSSSYFTTPLGGGELSVRAISKLPPKQNVRSLLLLLWWLFLFWIEFINSLCLEHCVLLLFLLRLVAFSRLFFSCRLLVEWPTTKTSRNVHNYSSSCKWVREDVHAVQGRSWSAASSVVKLNESSLKRSRSNSLLQSSASSVDTDQIVIFKCWTACAENVWNKSNNKISYWRFWKCRWWGHWRWVGGNIWQQFELFTYQKENVKNIVQNL